MEVLDILVGEEELSLFSESSLNAAVCPFVFVSGMSCPIVSCGLSTFSSKKSYQRHWDTRHKPQHAIFFCPLLPCQTTFRRRTDLRYHLRAIHHLQAESAESVLTNARHEVQANVNFIDPGSYKFVNTLPTSSGIPVSTVACTQVSTSVLPQLPSTEVPVTTLSSASSSDSSSVIIPPSLPAETSDAAIQVDTTSVLNELCLPVGTEELFKFISNVDLEISQLEKIRELALARLNGERELLRERELRRKLESENRKLKRELEHLKEDKSKNENYFSR